MKMKMRAKKVFALAMAALMIFALAACSVKDDASAGTSADDAKNLDDAVKIYKELMDEENKILSENQELWEKVFAAADKRDMTLQEDGKNYGDFLMDTIESAKDSFSADELKTLKEGAKRISEIENELTKLEEEYPEVREKAIDSAMDASGDGSMSVPADSDNVDVSKAQKFPAFDGKDFDGNKVNSDKLFSKNKVTVVNFWFTTCKPCVEELKELEALNKELAKKGGQVVGVNAFTLDGDKQAIADAQDVLGKKGVTYKNIWFKSDSKAGEFTTGMYSFPTTYVVDQKGNIVGKPISGGITSDEQKKALNDLIDQALESSK